MRIFLDESFDNRHRYLLLGALFVPTPRLGIKQLEAIKEKHRRLSPGHTFADVKYSRSGGRFYFGVCKELIDLFAQSEAYFRCVVIDTSMPGFSWSHFGGVGASPAVIKARAYSKLTELLLRPNLLDVENAVLLADSLSPLLGDDFLSYISICFGITQTPPAFAVRAPQIRHVQRVDTGLDQYQVGQLCDLLLGVVLGDLIPPKNSNKLELIRCAKERLSIPSFNSDYWLAIDEPELHRKHSKFRVWHWRPE